MFNRFFISTTILILLALSSLGCAAGDRTGRVSTPAVDVTGTWEGAISFTTGADRSVRWVLQQNGAKVNVRDRGEGFTALMFAASEGHIDVVKLLLKHDADKTLRDIDGDTAASFARKNGHTKIVDLLD